MDFIQKKAAYHNLLGVEHLETDRTMLRQKYPEAPALKTGMVNLVKAQSDILWDLLDVATPEEIEENRMPEEKFKVESQKFKVESQKAKVEEKAGVPKEIKGIPGKIKGAFAPLPEATGELKVSDPVVEKKKHPAKRGRVHKHKMGPARRR